MDFHRFTRIYILKCIWGTFLIILFINFFVYGQSDSTSASLLNDLACGNCHNGIPKSKLIYDKAPDLSDAGRRYPPDYLLQFLQNPYQVRKDIGSARMPDFDLSEREALALTLFLGTQLPGDSVAPSFNTPLTDAARAKADRGGVVPVADERLRHQMNSIWVVIQIEVLRASTRSPRQHVPRWMPEWQVPAPPKHAD